MKSAIQMTRIANREVVASQLELMAAKSGDERAKAEALAATSSLRTKNASDQAALATMEVDRRIKFYEAANEKAKIEAAGQGAGAEFFVPGYGMALDKESAKEARSMVAAHNSLSKEIENAIALRKKYGSETMPSEVRAQMESIRASMMGSANQLLKFGALDKGAVEQLDKMIGDPAAYGQQLPKLMQFKTTMDRKLRGTLDAYMDPRSYKSPTRFQNKLEQ
jgi:hypothetical protein